MAFLDFIKNRGGQGQAVEQQSQQQKPDVSQDISAKAAPDNSAAKPTDYVRPEQQARLAEAQALYSKGTQQPEQMTSAPGPMPAEGATDPQPMRQNMMSQDKAAPDLSPTSAQAGTRALEVDGPSAPTPTPAKSQQQTIARPSPSWER
jgi:hypothetical protein